MKLGSSFAKISKCNEYKTLEQYRAKNILRQITKEKFFLTGEQKYQNTHTEAPITQYVHLLTHSSPCPRCYFIIIWHDSTMFHNEAQFNSVAVCTSWGKWYWRLLYRISKVNQELHSRHFCLIWIQRKPWQLETFLAAVHRIWIEGCQHF